jgi:hypothetical protein
MYSGKLPERADEGKAYSEEGVVEEKLLLRGSCCGGYCPAGGCSVEKELVSGRQGRERGRETKMMFFASKKNDLHAKIREGSWGGW